MDFKTALMTGAATAALAVGQAFAALPAATAPAVPIAASYAELLEPIPNAIEQLKMADAQSAARPARLILAQWDHHHHHHHHHHDSAWYRHNGYSWDGGRWVLGLAHHHHHHHSRWWYRQNGYEWYGGAWRLRDHHHHHHHHHHHNN